MFSACAVCGANISLIPFQKAICSSISRASIGFAFACATSNAAVRSIEQAAATRQEFLQQHYAQVSELFSALVGKMTATINDENSHPTLRDQAAALTALTNFIKEFTPTEE